MATTSVVTYEALQLFTAWLITSANKYLGWGTNSGHTAARTDTALATETYSTQNNGTGNQRVTGTQSQQTTTQTNDTYQVQGTLTVASGTGAITITEAGVFDNVGTAANLTTAPSGGNMSLYSTFSGLPLNVGDSVQFTHKLQFT